MADDYLLDVAVLVGIYSILGLGLSIVIGQAGFWTSAVAFYAIGAYWTAPLHALRRQLRVLLPTGAALAAVLGSSSAIRRCGSAGLPAIVTLGFGEIIRITLNNWRALTNGPMGIMNVRTRGSRSPVAGRSFRLGLRRIS